DEKDVPVLGRELEAEKAVLVSGGTGEGVARGQVTLELEGTDRGAGNGALQNVAGEGAGARVGRQIARDVQWTAGATGADENNCRGNTEGRRTYNGFSRKDRWVPVSRRAASLVTAPPAQAAAS